MHRGNMNLRRPLDSDVVRPTMRLPANVATLAIVILVVTALSVRGRSPDPSLYNEALRAGVEAMDREWGKLNLAERGTRVPIDFHNPIVRKHASIPQGVSSQFGEYRMTYLDDAALVVRWKKLRKPFAILAIRPLDGADRRLKITIDLLWVNYRRGQLQFSIDSWANVYFRHDSSTGKYVVDDVELAGV